MLCHLIVIDSKFSLSNFLKDFILEYDIIIGIIAAKRRRNDRYRKAILDIMDLIDGYMQTQIGKLVLSILEMYIHVYNNKHTTNLHKH